jgi:hypothetical protein
MKEKHCFTPFNMFQDVQTPEMTPELAKPSNLGMGVIEAGPKT